MPKQAVLFWMPMWGGFHEAAWRAQDAPADPAMNFAEMRRMLQIAERGKFHACFLADSLSVGAEGTDVAPELLSRTAKGARWEPITLLSALSMCTEQIGLMATSSTTYNEPYHVARLFASLDHLSNGRAGWNVVTSGSNGESFNFGRDRHMDHTLRYERGQEFVDAVTGLWDSWEDEAFVGDKASGVYFDPERLHALSFSGRHLSVAGPLNMPRTPQGRPVLAQAGSSEVGRAFAARNADVIYTLQADLQKGMDFYAEVKEQVAENGREPDQVKILPALVCVVGRSQADADERLAELDSLVDPVVGLDNLANMLEHDLSGAPLDGPVPDIPEAEVGSKTRQRYFLDLAKRDNLTVRQLMQAGARRGAFAGSANGIADMIQEWVQAGAADGMNVTFADASDSLEVFVDEVIPELQRRGIFHHDYAGSSLRENLGLPRPSNRFAPERAGGLQA